MQSSLLGCDLSPENASWRALQSSFDACFGSSEEEECMKSRVAPRFPFFDDPLCPMGVPRMGSNRAPK